MIVYGSNYDSPRHSEGIFDARGNPFSCGSKSRAMRCIARCGLHPKSTSARFALGRHNQSADWFRNDAYF